MTTISDYTPAAGYPGYYVDADGGVWTARQSGPRPDRLVPTDPRQVPHPSVLRRLRVRRLANGYWYVNLRTAKRSATVRLNRLVAATFHGEPADLCTEAAHRDGDRNNNRPDNLYWATKQQNMADRDRHGRTARGERVGTAKLSSEAIRRIRSKRADGWSQQRIADSEGVSQSIVSLIVRGVYWAGV